MSFNFIELAREEGYVTSTTAEDGATQCTFQLKGVDDETPPLVSDLSAFATWLCGGVDSIEPAAVEHTDPSGGKIRRRMPKLHSFLPEQSIAGVKNLYGLGTSTSGNCLAALGLPSVTEQFTHYQRYNYVTEFKRRPYFLVPDEFIARPKGTYVRPDGTAQDIYYAEEWKRYCTTQLTPTPDIVNATAGGQMRFRTTGPLNGAQYPGNVSLYMQNQVLEVTWYLVPYRYFFRRNGAKPYLTRFVNTVNQNTLMDNDPGTMLFLGATPINVFQPQSTNILRLLGLGFTQSQSLLCNVKLRWLVTSREADDVPAAGTSGLANKNNIAAGFNLQPSFTDRKFHYVTVEDPANPADTTKWRASFPSFPHELFFTDPMLTQTGGAI